MNPLITLQIETTNTKSVQETILNHHIKIILNFSTRKLKIIKAMHQKIKKFNPVQFINETNSDPPGIDNTETSELQLNHIHCEATDDESDTENTFNINMIKVEKEN